MQFLSSSDRRAGQSFDTARSPLRHALRGLMADFGRRESKPIKVPGKIDTDQTEVSGVPARVKRNKKSGPDEERVVTAPSVLTGKRE